MHDERRSAQAAVLTEAQMKRVMRRAIELDSARDQDFSDSEVQEIARELGVSSSSIARALRESNSIRRGVSDPLSLYERALAVERDANGPGWVRRAIRRGVLMGLGVGCPVGLLIAFTTPAAELPSGGRVAAILLFVGVTIAWTIPFSFGTRWLALRSIDRQAPQ